MEISFFCGIFTQKKMKKIVLTCVAAGAFMFTWAQVQMPAPSPTQTIKQDFGMSSIELVYSRPSAKGRTVIGNLEPYNTLWRTGANAATRITFNDTVSVLGHKVIPGSYAIYTIPQKNGEWTFILNRGFKNAGTDGYTQSEDVLREKVKAGKNAQKVETLTMQFSDVKPESINLNIKWEDFALKIPITTEIKDRLRAQIEAALQTNKKPYWQAASFYADLGNDKRKALEMMDSAIAQTPNPMFFMVLAKARLQAELGDKKDALKTARQSLELSKAAKNDSYIRWSEELIEKLK